MKVPYSWLTDLVDPGLPIKELTHRMTMAGLEAEKLEIIGELWDNVFVGHVQEVVRHPDADRLVLATVDYGQGTLTVVTGAPNIAQGQKVALALAGARLYDGHSEERVLKTLKPGSIRGVKSEGMVCSEKELGMSDEHEGILVLEEDAPVGSPLQGYLGDTVIEFEITPNLVHAFSVVGIAREVGALTDTPVRLPDAPSLSTVPQDAALVRVEDTDLCRRYVAVKIDGLKIGPSPSWMQRRLVAAGLRPINNVVDVTNYVMLEWGQPTHAFDAAKIDGGTIVVRRARAGETIETLDHQQRELRAGMLVIADQHKPIGVAGVMGGFESEVTEGTTSIILEAANFDMSSVRATSRGLKLRTDASARYERGIDPTLCAEAAGRIVRLLMDMCAGARAVSMADVYPDPVMPRDMAMPFSEFERLIGVPYAPEVVEDALARLGFGVELQGEALTVSIPTWRTDVTQPADVVEEVARLVGYDALPTSLPRGETAPVFRDPVYLLSRGVRSTLVGCGGFETLTYTTIGETHLEAFAAEAASGFLHRVPTASMLRLRNPLQSERPLLRTTLVPSLIETVAANLRHQRGVRLFEIARAYLPTGGELPDERPVVAIAIGGTRDPLSRFAGSEMMDFFDLKGMVDTVLDRAGVVFHLRAAEAPGLHPGRTAEVMVGETRIGLLGELRPDVAAVFGIEDVRVAVAELDLGLMLAAAQPVKGVRVERFLPVEQDFAVVVAEDVTAGAVREALLAGAGPLVSDIALFDVYRGPQVGEDRKSLAWRITFTAPDRALTDAELLKVRERIGKVLKQRVAGELRA